MPECAPARGRVRAECGKKHPNVENRTLWSATRYPSAQCLKVPISDNKPSLSIKDRGYLRKMQPFFRSVPGTSFGVGARWVSQDHRTELVGQFLWRRSRSPPDQVIDLVSQFLGRSIQLRRTEDRWSRVGTLCSFACFQRTHGLCNQWFRPTVAASL